MAFRKHQSHPDLFDERSPLKFRDIFGGLLSRSSSVDSAILRVRLAAVDLTEHELREVSSLRVLVAEVNSQTVEEEVYALAIDPSKRENLSRLLDLLRRGVMEIRSAPLGGWSPDFTVFSARGRPHTLLLGDHWFHRPFPHRGPAWAGRFGAEGARRAKARFDEVWSGAHDIGPAVRRLMERTSVRACPGRGIAPFGDLRMAGSRAVDTPEGPG